MDISAISPVGSATITPPPTTAAESTFLIDTYGAPAFAALVAAAPVYVQPAAPLVRPVDPVAGIRGTRIDTTA
jgi:hypothetical protein